MTTDSENRATRPTAPAPDAHAKSNTPSKSSKSSSKPSRSAPSDEKPAPEGERLQKLLARAGVASRRAAEEIIREGRVSVNGHTITELGVRADLLRDRVTLDGKPLTLPSAPPAVVLLHKPKGYVTTLQDPEGRPTVMDLLDRDIRRKHPRLHPVGRLDFDTAGVLLLTDDGDLTQLLTHPSHGVKKVYQARVSGTVALETVRALERGIQLEDGMTAPCRVRVRAQTPQNALVEITLQEGRNRQVRRMLAAVGHPVSSLRRVKFGDLNVQGMGIAESRVLLPGEVSALRKRAEDREKITPRAPAHARTSTATTKPRSTNSSARAANSGGRRPSSSSPLSGPRFDARSASPRAGASSKPGTSARSGAAARPRGKASTASVERTSASRTSVSRTASSPRLQPRAGNNASEFNPNLPPPKSRGRAAAPPKNKTTGKADSDGSAHHLARRIEQAWKKS